MVQESLNRPRIHRTLVRRALLLGVPPELVFVEALVVVAILLFAGAHFPVLLTAAAFLGLLHKAVAHFAAQDPRLVEIFLDSLRYRSFYPALGGFHQERRR